MNLCDDGHQEVCFEGRDCPVCAKINEMAGLEEKIGELKKEIEDIENSD